MKKIAGEANPADSGTKAHPVQRFLKLRDLARIVDCSRIDDQKELVTAAMELGVKKLLRGAAHATPDRRSGRA